MPPKPAANTCPTCGRHIPGRKPTLTANPTPPPWLFRAAPANTREGTETMNGTKLNTGTQYDTEALRVTGWVGPAELIWIAPGVRNPAMDGYDAWAYFANDGRYLGPDEHGLEPLFSAKEKE